MRLIELAEMAETNDVTLERIKPDLDIVGLSADSRAVLPGYLFAAIPGTSLDGRRFISDAIQRGAVAVLAPPSPTIALDRDDIELPLTLDKVWRLANDGKGQS